MAWALGLRGCRIGGGGLRGIGGGLGAAGIGRTTSSCGRPGSGFAGGPGRAGLLIGGLVLLAEFRLLLMRMFIGLGQVTIFKGIQMPLDFFHHGSK
jgi:hypothetical protein